MSSTNPLQPDSGRGESDLTFAPLWYGMCNKSLHSQEKPGMERGPSSSHHLSHIESVRLRLLGAARFIHFLEEWGAMGSSPGPPRTLREVLTVNLIRILTGQSGP